MSDVIPPEEFEAAVRRSGLGVTGVAELLGISRSRVHTYMKEGVSDIRSELVRDRMGQWFNHGLEGAGSVPLAYCSDMMLIAELARRLAERGGTPSDRPPMSSAPHAAKTPEKLGSVPTDAPGDRPAAKRGKRPPRRPIVEQTASGTDTLR